LFVWLARWADSLPFAAFRWSFSMLMSRSLALSASTQIEIRNTLRVQVNHDWGTWRIPIVQCSASEIKSKAFDTERFGIKGVDFFNSHRERKIVMNAPIPTYLHVIDEICGLNWKGINRDDLFSAAWAYYFFSIQFRENLQIARALYPDDANLKQLEDEECDTHNLSPWPGIALPGERMNHDEFMRRSLELCPVDPNLRCRM
jgi:hypothetical protein